jgi:hypothetical protein
METGQRGAVRSQEEIDRLAMLVDGAVQVAPPAPNAHMGLVDADHRRGTGSQDRRDAGRDGEESHCPTNPAEGEAGAKLRLTLGRRHHLTYSSSSSIRQQVFEAMLPEQLVQFFLWQDLPFSDRRDEREHAPGIAQIGFLFRRGTDNGPHMVWGYVVDQRQDQGARYVVGGIVAAAAGKEVDGSVHGLRPHACGNHLRQSERVQAADTPHRAFPQGWPVERVLEDRSSDSYFAVAWNLLNLSRWTASRPSHASGRLATSEHAIDSFSSPTVAIAFLI